MIGLANHLYCVYDAFSSCHVSFFSDDESDNGGYGSGSPGMCTFPFCSGNYVGRFSGVGSGVFVPTGIDSIGDIVLLIVFVPIGVESKVG